MSNTHADIVSKQKRLNTELDDQVQKMRRSIRSVNEEMNRERSVRTFLIALLCASVAAFLVTLVISLRKLTRKKNLVKVRKGEPDDGETAV
eukprot:252216_1